MAYIIQRTADGKVQFIDEYLYGEVADIKETVDNRINEHLHQDQEVSPYGADPILLTSGGAPYTYGAYSADIIAANQIPYLFDLHWVVLTGASANGHFEIEFVYGASDTFACAAAFSRTNAFTSSITLPLMTIQMPANSRVRARMRDSAGGLTVSAKVLYHDYPIS